MPAWQETFLGRQPALCLALFFFFSPVGPIAFHTLRDFLTCFGVHRFPAPVVAAGAESRCLAAPRHFFERSDDSIHAVSLFHEFLNNPIDVHVCYVTQLTARTTTV